MKIKKIIRKLWQEIFLVIILSWIVIFLAGLLYQYFFVPYVFKEKAVPFSKFLRTVFFMGIFGFPIRLILFWVGRKLRPKRK